MDAAFQAELQAQLVKMGPADQQRVLEFLRSINSDQSAPSALEGTPGNEIIKFAGLFPSEDLKEIEQAIKEGCEQVDLDGW